MMIDLKSFFRFEQDWLKITTALFTEIQKAIDVQKFKLNL